MKKILIRYVSKIYENVSEPWNTVELLSEFYATPVRINDTGYLLACAHNTYNNRDGKLFDADGLEYKMLFRMPEYDLVLLDYPSYDKSNTLSMWNKDNLPSSTVDYDINLCKVYIKSSLAVIAYRMLAAKYVCGVAEHNLSLIESGVSLSYDNKYLIGIVQGISAGDNCILFIPYQIISVFIQHYALSDPTTYVLPFTYDVIDDNSICVYDSTCTKIKKKDIIVSCNNRIADENLDIYATDLLKSVKSHTVNIELIRSTRKMSVQCALIPRINTYDMSPSCTDYVFYTGLIIKPISILDILSDERLLLQIQAIKPVKDCRLTYICCIIGSVITGISLPRTPHVIHSINGKRIYDASDIDTSYNGTWVIEFYNKKYRLVVTDRQYGLYHRKLYEIINNPIESTLTDD